MSHKLVLRQYIDLPFHAQGDFDHGDVTLSNGYVFIANTAAGTVEVVDGEHLRHLVTIPARFRLVLLVWLSMQQEGEHSHEVDYA
jgi:hypothetical protein